MKVASGVAALLIAGGLGASLKRSASAENPFSTDIPVPTETQPHIDYTVKAGDTESSITAKFDVTGYDTTDYENMINKQLPKQEQHDRDVHPGDQLRLPPVTS